MTNNVNVINNTGKKFNVTVSENANKIEIIIDLAKSEFKLPRNLKPGEVFKDIDGDEYIFLYCSEEGNAGILRKDNLLDMKFGSNNNYDGSDIDNYLNNTYLKELERKFGAENIVEHEVDLLSLDGEYDYGVIKRKVSISTFDQYRMNKRMIKKYLGKSFWLATPNSTPSGFGSDDVRYVYSDGHVFCGWYNDCVGVRPFFILSSSIFES